MLRELVSPILAALTVEDNITIDVDLYIEKCWGYLFHLQFQRRGCPPWTLQKSIEKSPRYAWRGFFPYPSGGDVFGL